MNGIDKNKILFIPSGCLTNEGVSGYALNQLTSDKMKKIKKHIDSCKICADAIEGFLIVNNEKKFSASVKRINEKIIYKNQKRRKTLSFYSVPVMIAASVVILFVFRLLYIEFNNNTKYHVQRKIGGNITTLKTDNYFEIMNINSSYEMIEFNFSKDELNNLNSSKKFKGRSENQTERKILKNDVIINQYNVPYIPDNNKNCIEIIIKEKLEILMRNSGLAQKCNLMAEFTINKEGVITNPRIVDGCNSVIDDITLKVLNDTPRLHPATINNIPVDYPVRLFINSDE